MNRQDNWVALLAYTTVAVSLCRQASDPVVCSSLASTRRASAVPLVASPIAPPGSAASHCSPDEAANGLPAPSTKDYNLD